MPMWIVIGIIIAVCFIWWWRNSHWDEEKTITAEPFSIEPYKSGHFQGVTLFFTDDASEFCDSLDIFVDYIKAEFPNVYTKDFEIKMLISRQSFDIRSGILTTDLPFRDLSEDVLADQSLAIKSAMQYCKLQIEDKRIQKDQQQAFLKGLYEN